MTINKRKKNSRQRGSHTHGWGSKHRGSGSRGGFGMAGTGKRADQKKPSVWNERYFGKHGFVSKNKTKIRAINLLKIKESLDSWVSNGLVSNENGFYFVELKKLGYNKLISKGSISLKLKISVPYASENAIKKIREAGGEVIGLVVINNNEHKVK